MSWSLNEITLEERREKGWQGIEPGNFWRIPLDHDMHDGKTYERVFGSLLSPEFRASGRDYVICVRLPDDMEWCLDHRPNNGVSGWVVSGELPTVTARPSIGSHNYHGWLTDGVLSDDLEGRTYS